MHTATLSFTPGLISRPAAAPADEFLHLTRRHQQLAFQITFGLLRDEIAAETLTCQVFNRARRRFASGMDAIAVTRWIYHASLRFACRYYWKNTTPAMRRQLCETSRNTADNFDLSEFVHVLALHPGKIDPRDCELISLRHVIKLPVTQIGQLLRMHPYEISNRLIWSRERVKEVRGFISLERHAYGHPQCA
jgi:hypothetical protein